MFGILCLHFSTNVGDRKWDIQEKRSGFGVSATHLYRLELMCRIIEDAQITVNLNRFRQARFPPFCGGGCTERVIWRDNREGHGKNASDLPAKRGVEGRGLALNQKPAAGCEVMPQNRNLGGEERESSLSTDVEELAGTQGRIGKRDASMIDTNPMPLFRQERRRRTGRSAPRPQGHRSRDKHRLERTGGGGGSLAWLRVPVAMEGGLIRAGDFDTIQRVRLRNRGGSESLQARSVRAIQTRGGGSWACKKTGGRSPRCGTAHPGSGCRWGGGGRHVI